MIDMSDFSLKNVPDELYEFLRASAELNHRSINGELIHLLERSLKPTRRCAKETRETARMLRTRLEGRLFTPDEIDRFKNTEGNRTPSYANMIVVDTIVIAYPSEEDMVVVNGASGHCSDSG